MDRFLRAVRGLRAYMKRVYAMSVLDRVYRVYRVYIDSMAA